MKKYFNISYIAIVGGIVFLTFALHELAHYLMGVALGYPMHITLNSVFLAEGSYDPAWHKQIVSAAGPVFTIITAIVFYILLRKKESIYAYSVLFTAFIMRLMAGLISLSSPNDEARISESLGIGRMTLPLIVILLLIGLTYSISKKYNYGIKINAWNFVLVSFFITVVVLADQYIIKDLMIP